MKLGELLRELPVLHTGADATAEVSSLAYNSREVGPGTLFFAIQGEKADGHAYIPQALERGAVAVVSERAAPPELAARWIQVAAIRRALADAGRIFFGHPEKRLQLIGITGTNGKTTTTYLVESVLGAAGILSGVFGTIEYRMGGKTKAATNTTPESLDLLSYFAELVKAGGKAAVMEVSSHSLAQERVWGFHFAVAVFTNLTQDHLDYHKDFEHYFQAKRRLFEGLGAPPPDWAVINIDDPWGARLAGIAVSEPSYLWPERRRASDAQARRVQSDGNGSRHRDSGGEAANRFSAVGARQSGEHSCRNCHGGGHGDCQHQD